MVDMKLRPLDNVYMRYDYKYIKNYFVSDH